MYEYVHVPVDGISRVLRMKTFKIEFLKYTFFYTYSPPPLMSCADVKGPFHRIQEVINFICIR